MPEGDVVRRTAVRIDAALSGRTLVRAELRWPGASGVDFVGRTVLETVSVGKHLLTRIDDGRTVHSHLRMDGTWSVARTGAAASRARGPWVRAVLANDLWTCTGTRLGMLDVVRTRDENVLVGHLGPDVLAADFPGSGVVEATRRLGADGARPVAAALLDQRCVAGFGTIYTAESLWAGRTSPWTPVGAVADLRGVLLAGRAAMLLSADRGLDARTSDVYGRAGRSCRRCGTTIATGSAGDAPQDRTIYWCPGCQVG
ncbi:putative endonuclease 8 2 [Paraoerskovia sediminicola]|uniref:DNA-(apurinic or apyrimidinic site) lyase n=1 Tax=Paraoerskovia sediminicola TaxID=1138587 RepID=A0ABN6XG62_9CELL|nr:DNA-formamidopyrimidine glycosylase family protein [Paraoerskovia sediminicola]BDZ43888.1 putative endonuclease 8 2 [Paraoerskovia sediminicola]